MNDKTELLIKIDRYVDSAIDNLRAGYQGMAKDDIYMIEKLLKNCSDISDVKKEEYQKIIDDTYRLIYADDLRSAIYKIDELKRF